VRTYYLFSLFLGLFSCRPEFRPPWAHGRAEVGVRIPSLQLVSGKPLSEGKRLGMVRAHL
jgi:hypothetical protein